MAEEDKQGTGWRGLGMAGCGEDMVDGGRAGDLAGGGGGAGVEGRGGSGERMDCGRDEEDRRWGGRGEGRQRNQSRRKAVIAGWKQDEASSRVLVVVVVAMVYNGTVQEYIILLSIYYLHFLITDWAIQDQERRRIGERVAGFAHTPTPKYTHPILVRY